MEIGKDNEESCVEAGVQCVQVQNAAYPETLQTVRAAILLGSTHTDRSFSFELGGEKKTKGAALTFVRPLISLLRSVAADMASRVVSVSFSTSMSHLFSTATLLRI